jgi:hypothetical protein
VFATEAEAVDAALVSAGADVGEAEGAADGDVAEDDRDGDWDWVRSCEVASGDPGRIPA